MSEKVTQRMARRSFGEPYSCKKPWPSDCFVQCGGRGIVLSSPIEEAFKNPDDVVGAIAAVTGGPIPKGGYRTAFFEAFPREPECFLRGEGKTIEEAEERCWSKLERIRACPGHDFDRRERKDGFAFCRLCGLAGSFLEPLTTCSVCGTRTHEAIDNKGRMFCLDHYYELDFEADIWKQEKEFGLLETDLAESKRIFFREAEKRQQLLLRGVVPGGREWKRMDNLLLQAEVSDRELETEDTASMSGEEIRQAYRNAFPRLLSWAFKNRGS